MQTLRRWMLAIGQTLVRFGQPDHPFPVARDVVLLTGPPAPLTDDQVANLRAVFIRTPPAIVLPDTRIIDAVSRAWATCGLNPHAFELEADLVRTGKLHEVLHHAALDLGVDHPVRTVGDVVRILTDRVAGEAHGEE